MSSGTNANVAQVGALLRSDDAKDLVQEGNGGALTSRQMILNKYWSFYRCMTYEKRQVDWDGRPVTTVLDDEVIASAQFIPPGFYDANDSMLPLKHRKPTAPYHLAKVIVNRFTSLLFGARNHPKLLCVDDQETEDWLNGFAEVTRLWSRMIVARTLGGAIGSVGLGFVFHHGRPKVEIHDPRWCSVDFLDRDELTVESFEKRYLYPGTIRDPDTGQLVEAMYWYRRVITSTTDTVWPKVPVTESEPLWANYRSTVTEHNYGFCPVVWIQNMGVQDDIDGDPDCHGVFDTIEAIDALLSQANRGILSNCDPTLVVATPDEMDGNLRKGSDNAIKMSSGNATYLEINGAGPKAAQELADKLELQALRVARCVLNDNFQGPARTEREVDQNYSNMVEQASILREQYGEHGVKKLLEMVLRAARMLTKARMVEEGTSQKIVRQVIKLPPPKDDPARKRVLGEGSLIELDWPDWYEPSLDEINKAVDAASKAYSAQLVDREHAVRFIAHYFDIEDVGELVARMDEEAAAAFEDPSAAYSTEMEEPVTDEAADFADSIPDIDMPPLEDMELEDTLAPSSPDEKVWAGAQVASLIEVLEKVYAGTLPAAAAREVILAAFPTVDEVAVDRMLAHAPSITPVVDTVPEDAPEPEDPGPLSGVREVP